VMFLELKLEGYTTLEDIWNRSMSFPMPKFAVKFYFLPVTYTKKNFIIYLLHSDYSISFSHFNRFFLIEMVFYKLYSEYQLIVSRIYILLLIRGFI
jgi:hypothetical protein